MQSLSHCLTHVPPGSVTGTMLLRAQPELGARPGRRAEPQRVITRELDRRAGYGRIRPMWPCNPQPAILWLQVAGLNCWVDSLPTRAGMLTWRRTFCSAARLLSKGKLFPVSTAYSQHFDCRKILAMLSERVQRLLRDPNPVL